MSGTVTHTATPCSTLQHVAAHCNTLQHTATHCNALQHTLQLRIPPQATSQRFFTCVLYRHPCTCISLFSQSGAATSRHLGTTDADVQNFLSLSFSLSTLRTRARIQRLTRALAHSLLLFLSLRDTPDTKLASRVHEVRLIATVPVDIPVDITATHCTTLQRTAPHYATLNSTTTRC